MDKQSKILLAIDPGDIQSAFCFIDVNTYEPLYFAKEKNEDVIIHIISYITGDNTVRATNVQNAAIEMIASYGMGVGKSVFETCIWIGRFYERLKSINCNIEYIYRKDETMNLCGSMRAKDSNVRIALIDRFAKFDFKNGKGTKKNKDWFYGFSADIWAAYACGVTWIDIQKKIYTTIENKARESIKGE